MKCWNSMLRLILRNFQEKVCCLLEENSVPYRWTNFISSRETPTWKFSLMLDILNVIRNIFPESETFVPRKIIMLILFIYFSSFLFRYADDSFTSAFVSTVGIDFKVKTVFRHDKRVKLQIWVRRQHILFMIKYSLGAYENTKKCSRKSTKNRSTLHVSRIIWSAI